MRIESTIKSSKSVSCINVPVDTVFRGVIGNIAGIFLKGFECIIDLCNPRNTWRDLPDLVVKEYVPVDAVLKIEE